MRSKVLPCTHLQYRTTFGNAEWNRTTWKG
uniref:Uncharacterized protein n=1 Tax=Anopheles minimus TaxID=112268 RepID=A0A182WQ94_9DIPT